jgi:hypothetical protein
MTSLHENCATRYSHLLALVAALLISANIASADHLDAVQQALSENRQTWDALGIEDYDFRMQRSCLCATDFIQPGLVHVRGGQIVSVENADTGVEIEAANYLTVDGLFDYLQSSVDNHAFQMTTAFDATLGHPTETFVDGHEFIADDRTSIAASQLLVVPEPTTLTLTTLALLTFTYRRPRRHRPGSQASHVPHDSA